jgi:hypothetical protein
MKDQSYERSKTLEQIRLAWLVRKQTFSLFDRGKWEIAINRLGIM